MKSHELFTKNHAFVPWRAFEVQVRKRLGFLWYEGLHYLAQEAWTVLEEQFDAGEGGALNCDVMQKEWVRRAFLLLEQYASHNDDEDEAPFDLEGNVEKLMSVRAEKVERLKRLRAEQQHAKGEAARRQTQLRVGVGREYTPPPIFGASKAVIDALWKLGRDDFDLTFQALGFFSPWALSRQAAEPSEARAHVEDDASKGGGRRVVVVSDERGVDPQLLWSGTVQLAMFSETDISRDKVRAPRGNYKLHVFEDIVAFEPVDSRALFLGDTHDVERQSAARTIQLWYLRSTGQFARFIKESAQLLARRKEVLHLNSLSMVIVKAECANEVQWRELEDNDDDDLFSMSSETEDGVGEGAAAYADVDDDAEFESSESSGDEEEMGVARKKKLGKRQILLGNHRVKRVIVARRGLGRQAYKEKIEKQFRLLQRALASGFVVNELHRYVVSSLSSVRLGGGLNHASRLDLTVMTDRTPPTHPPSVAGTARLPPFESTRGRSFISTGTITFRTWRKR
jgi:hypothetical protein